jgi:hypothetical protein
MGFIDGVGLKLWVFSLDIVLVPKFDKHSKIYQSFTGITPAKYASPAARSIYEVCSIY